MENENIVETTEQEAKTYTQEELDKLLQKETDKRVTSALNTAKTKWESEYQDKLKEETSEAEKLAKMSEEDRFKALFDKEKETFEQERQEFLKSKLDMQIVTELSNAGLPVEFKDFVTGTNAEEITSNIKVLTESWSNAINKAVDERLKGRTPKTSNTSVETEVMSKKDFAKLSTSQRAELLEKDPDLIKKLK